MHGGIKFNQDPRAFEHGLDIGMYVAAAASVAGVVVAGVVIALVTLRHSGAADAPAGRHANPEVESHLPSADDQPASVDPSAGAPVVAQ